jgi:hypothetical protein
MGVDYIIVMQSDYCSPHLQGDENIYVQFLM